MIFLEGRLFPKVSAFNLLVSPFLADSLLPRSLSSGLSCIFLSISTLGKMRGRGLEGLEARQWSKRGERRGEGREGWRTADVTLPNVQAMTNDQLMT